MIETLPLGRLLLHRSGGGGALRCRQQASCSSAYRSFDVVALKVFSTKAKQPHPIKIDLNKKLDSKQKTIQTFNIDAQRLRKMKIENPLTQEMGVTS